MGFIFALFYLAVAYLGTKTVFGPFAAYHLEEILAIMVVLISLPALQKTYVLKTAQTIALGGLAIAVFMSMLIGKRYARGALTEFLAFIPNAFAYFLVVLHCNSKKRLQMLVLMLVFVCTFVIYRGLTEMKDMGDAEPLHAAEGMGPAPNPDSYLLPQWISEGVFFYRLRGQNFLNDPNDFGQLLVCVMPLLFIFWRPKSIITNLLVIGPFFGLLGYGLYLTHSRGDLLALMVLIVVAARRRIGTIPAVVVAGGLLAAAMALNATGGRGISASAGEDRTALWGDGLALLKEHPLFGAGYNQMADIIGKTAHNSIIVCAAELGIFGMYFWSLFLFPTLRDAIIVASPTAVGDGEPEIPDDGPYRNMTTPRKVMTKEEINHLGRLIVFSLAGFLAAAMFLSRAFVMTFFLLGGMAEVVFQMALERKMIAPRLPYFRVLGYSGMVAFVLVPGMYLLIRILNLAH